LDDERGGIGVKEDGLSEEERRLARRENASLARFFRAFLLSSLYGAIGFFALWSLKEGVPLLALALLPRAAQSSPSRLVTYATVAVSGVSWFVSYLALLFALERTEGARQIVKKLAIWCAAAALFWLAGEAMIRLAVKIG
jgi:hypothetical protein